jgi:carbonic anhydrase
MLNTQDNPLGLMNQEKSITGEVWNDINANGIKDNGEPSLNNIEVQLLNFEGSVVAINTTQNGFYQFNNLTSGPYLVKVNSGPNFFQTAPNTATTAERTPVTGSWDYDNDKTDGSVGPDQWGEVAPDANGYYQSPINITGVATDNLEEVLDFDYHSTNLTELVDKGTNVEIEYPEENGNTITFFGEEFELVQFHFHYHSEHEMDGQLSEMEVHLVHRNEEGDLAVVGLFIEQGETNQELEPFFEGVKNLEGDTAEIEEPFDLNNLIPDHKEGWFYQGSLTTPPATEAVNWFVFQDPIELSSEQIEIFRDYLASIGFDYNNRPVQPLNGRQLNEVDSQVTLAEEDVSKTVDFGLTSLPSVHRFFDPITGDHFYTTNPDEVKNIPSYQNEGIGFNTPINVPNQLYSDVLPVYRFYNSSTGDHFYTASEQEKDAVITNLNDYQYEGIGYYAYGADANIGADVYRFWNSFTGNHFYTASVSERDSVISNLPEYIYEGVAFEAII